MTETLKAVLVGCGGMANAWLTPVTEKFDDIDIVGLVDLNLDNANGLKNKFNLDHAVVGTDLEAVIKETGATAVFDVTVPAAHTPVTITAVNNGCHVLGEKPLAETMEKAKAMVSAAQENDKTYAVIQNRRYINRILQYRDMVQGGEIGDIHTLNADFYIGAHFGGFRDEMDHVLLLDMAIHSFDQARLISGKDPVSVYAHEFNPKGSWYAHGASAMVIFEMTDGTVFNYRGSWCAEGLNTSWECDWRAIGTQGTATWDGQEIIMGKKVIGTEGFMRDTEDILVPPSPELEHTGHAALIREFADCLKSGNTPQTICTDNITSLAMVEAAIESAESGKKVSINV